MVSRLITLVMLIVLPCLAFAQSVEIGSIIVVRGTVQHCVQWTDRILDMYVVEYDVPITLLYSIEVEVLNLDAKQIQTALLDEIEKRTGDRPTSIWVEVLPDEKYQQTHDEYIISTDYLLERICPDSPKPPIPRLERHPGFDPMKQDQRREELRLLEMFDSTC